MAWRIDGIGNTYRNAARKAAERAGLDLGAWLDRVILHHPAGPTREEADAEITRALAALESRIDQSSERLDRMIAPLRAEVDRLSEESDRLRAEDFAGRSRAADEIARHLERLDNLSRTPGRPEPATPAPEASSGNASTAAKPYLVAERPNPPGPGEDPEETNRDPWTRRHPHGGPAQIDLAALRRRRLIRLAGGIGAVVLIAGSVAAGVWVMAENAGPDGTPVVVQPGLTTPSADQTPPRVVAVIDQPPQPAAPGPGSAGSGPGAGDAAPRSAAAITQLRVRADGHDIEAAYQLGMALIEGKGTAPSPREGAEWIATAAVAGHPLAQMVLARLYAGAGAAFGLPRDPSQAFFWYQSAAEQGQIEAAYQLGMLYTEGNGVDRSHALAARWFREAGEKGHAPSLFQLGLIYELGLDYRPNRARALEWYRKAAAAGSQAAADKLRQLDGAAPPAQAPVPAAPAPTVAPPAPGPAAAPTPLAAPPAPPSKAKGASSAPPARARGLTRAEIAEMQRLLRRLDFEPGATDGRMTAVTADAIRQFQSVAGMPATGEASEALLRELRAIAGGGGNATGR